MEECDDELSALPIEVRDDYADDCYPSSMQIAQHMLAHLDGQSLLRVAGVSRWWRDVSEEEHVWHSLCMRLNIDTSRQISRIRHTFTDTLCLVYSSALLNTRYARVHAACPSKALYIHHQRTANNWCSRQVVVRTHKAGE
jgi:hypothetical protein